MTTFTRSTIALYADRATQQWIVRDPEGNFWLVPASNDGWERRQPYYLSEGAALEPVPGHYKYLLGLPF